VKGNLEMPRFPISTIDAVVLYKNAANCLVPVYGKGNLKIMWSALISCALRKVNQE